jgi:serine/threonine protein kinase/tetratricopeptide (TPR) repeat protein
MSVPESTDREKAIVARALALPEAAARSDYLQSACAGDPALRARVQTLLRAQDVTGNFRPSEASVAAALNLAVTGPAEESGTMIGRYKILQKIGEGGCGVVYMAEQEEPVRRRVALKIIKLGMDTKAVVARFEAERQALALMDHANIAKVFDAGATETGRPFFVMELVRGVPITTYCDQDNLPTRDRLQLFMLVCQAIQHAHQKGIIHRDIKPSNILVTLHDGVAVPKVIDFGIAKATIGRLTDETMFTAFAQFIGTPAYMSPEQAEMSGLDIDTRSDIYSLGVLLYELLTGNPPFDPQSLVRSGIDEVRRVIREVDPPKPSTRLGTLTGADSALVARLRRTDPAKLSLLLRGDLDWIVMKALEKNRTRRYETANALAADITRHLRHEPVIARPPSAGYLLQKLFQRHKFAFVAAGLLATSLIGGLALATTLYLQERRTLERARTAEQRTAQALHQAVILKNQAELARREELVAELAARHQADRSTQVAQFMKSMLAGVGPQVALGRDSKLLREILDQTSARLGGELNAAPDVEAELRTIIGSVYFDLGNYPEAETMLRAALAAGRKNGGGENEAVATAGIALGKTLLATSRPQEAETLTRAGLDVLKQLPGDHREAVGRALTSLAAILRMEMKGSEALATHDEAVALLRQTGAAGQLALADALGEQGSSRQIFDPPAAAASFREALVMQRQLLGTEHPQEANLLFKLAAVAYQQRNFAEAEARSREAHALFLKLLGPDHPLTASAASLLAITQKEQEKSTVTEPVANPGTTAGDPAAASRHLERAVALLQQGNVAAGRAEFAAALPGLSPNLATENPVLAHSMMMSAAFALQQGARPEVLEEMCRDSLALYRKYFPHDSPYVAAALVGLVESLVPLDKLAEAETAAREGLGIFDALGDAGNEYALELRDQLVVILTKLGRPAEADTAVQDALRILRQGHGADSLALASRLVNFAWSLVRIERFAEAEPLARDGLAIRQKLAPAGSWTIASAASVLGSSLAGEKKYPEAEPMLLQAYADLKSGESSIPTPGKSRIADTARALSGLYESTGQTEKAAEWKRKAGASGAGDPK